MSINSQWILVEHNALVRKLHWDLRFRIPDSKNWASFAFRMFPPTEPGKRVYIVRTNTHSESEALYIGSIPEGTFGAGTLKKVDGGKCEIIKYTNAHMIINFKGSKINGLYHIVSTSTFTKSRDYSRKTYAFFKAKTPIKT